METRRFQKLYTVTLKDVTGRVRYTTKLSYVGGSTVHTLQTPVFAKGVYLLSARTQYDQLTTIFMVQ